MYITHKIIFFCLAATSAASVLAAPPSSSPYGKAVLQSYVQDAASEGLNTPNMVMCIMNAMSPSDMLSQRGTANAKGEKEVQYIALVDFNKCDKSKQGKSSNSSSESTGSGDTPNWITATVNITRASNTAPMVGKIWMTVTGEDNVPRSVYVSSTATTSPSDSPPYGKLRIDYAGYSETTNSLGFQGFVEADGGNLTHVETGPQSGNTKLTLNATSATAGSGIMQTTDFTNGGNSQLNLQFAYNADYFARKMGGGDICFNRDKDKASKSVWQYGTYDATTGEIVDQKNPSFQLKGNYNGKESWGFASYWGINFGAVPQNTMAGFADGEISSITAITDQRKDHSETYKLFKSSGRLVKYTANQATLQDLDGVQINIGGDGCKLLNGRDNHTNTAISTPTIANVRNGTPCVAQNTSDFAQWIIQWNKTLADPSGAAGKGNFELVGVQYCGNGGCLAYPLPQPYSPIKAGFTNQPINAWSSSMGQINIPLASGNTMSNPNNSTLHQNSDPIYYYTQSVVLPSTNTLNLECLSNCPTAAAIAAYTTNQSNTNPFKTGTNTQWGSGTVKEAYTFGSDGLKDSSNNVVTGANLPASGSYQNGLTSGRLFESGTTTSSLVSGGNCFLNGGFCEPSNPASYYQFQTGSQMWNNSYWLTTSGNVVTFDPPVSITYNVPSTPAGQQAGAYDGKTVQMSFNGFGNIGIPGQCVKVSDNTKTDDCSGTGKRWVPAFALADGAQVTINGKAVLIKQLNAELRLKKEDCNAVGMSTNAASGMTLPTSTPLDPSLSASANYIGSKPTVTSAPAVIHGVIQ